MKLRFVGLTLCLPLPAQDGKPAEGLPALRAAFAAAQIAEPTVLIACLRGEPVVLLAGRDAGGQALQQETLLPLLGLGKVLAADAIHAAQKGRLDRGSGEKFGGRELTVRELLDGTALLPDYFVVDGSDGTADAAVLRACGDLAASARLQLRASAAGAPEFVLLEPLAFGGRYQDWPSMLRSTLGPRVPGLDPVPADAVPEAARARLPFAADELSKLAVARPALLRTLLSVKHLATWWHWRTQQAAQLWTSSRMGRIMRALSRREAQRWAFSTSALGFDIQGSQYPEQKAGFLWIGAIRAVRVHDEMLRAFEADLFNAGAESSLAEHFFVGGVAFDPRPSTMPAGPLTGSRWRSPPLREEASAFRLAFGPESAESLVLTAFADTMSFTGITNTGAGLQAVLRSADDTTRWLWLWPQPDRVRPVKLSAVLVTSRNARTAAATSPGSSVPQFVELLPEPK